MDTNNTKRPSVSELAARFQSQVTAQNEDNSNNTHRLSLSRNSIYAAERKSMVTSASDGSLAPPKPFRQSGVGVARKSITPPEKPTKPIALKSPAISRQNSKTNVSLSNESRRLSRPSQRESIAKSPASKRTSLYFEELGDQSIISLSERIAQLSQSSSQDNVNNSASNPFISISSPRSSILLPQYNSSIQNIRNNETIVSPRISKVPKATSQEVIPKVPSMDSVTSEDKVISKRHRIIDEIFQTEKGFLADMQVLHEIYVIPATNSSIFSASDIKLLFENVGKIIETSSEFLKVLGDGMSQPSPLIGLSFLTMVIHLD